MADKYQITENNLKSLLDWKQMVKNSSCKTKVRKGTYSGTEGHNNCNDGCFGNYWNGGTCNYQEHDHSLTDDLKQINNNFEWIDSILSNHQGLIGSNEDDFNSYKSSLMTAVGQARDACDNVGSFFRNTCLAERDENIILVKNGEKRFENLSEGLEK